MSLVNCKECKKEISDQATSCPGCGCPVATTVFTYKPVAVVAPKVQVVEQTGKNLKMHFMIAAMLFFLGFIFWVLTLSGQEGYGLIINRVELVVWISAFIYAVVVKILMYWHHG